MTRRVTFDILAAYAPSDRRRKPIIRHIASISTDQGNPDITDLEKHARNTMPDAAAHLAGMMTLPRGTKGHAETMAKVNYWHDAKNRVPA